MGPPFDGGPNSDWWARSPPATTPTRDIKPRALDNAASGACSATGHCYRVWHPIGQRSALAFPQSPRTTTSIGCVALSVRNLDDHDFRQRDEPLT